MMKKIFYLIIFLSVSIQSFGFSIKKEKKRLLVFSYTQKYRHKSIEAGIIALEKLAKEKGYLIENTENVNDFNDSNLSGFNALIFLNPTGTNIFNDEQKSAFQKFIRSGGGFVEIHAATDCNYEWEWYGKLVGAFFSNHPKIQEAELDVLKNNHLSTKGLPKRWKHKDEWYNFKDFNNDVKVLISLDESTYSGGKMKDFHPISWYHKYDGGKAFYTALGHTDECYTDKFFLKHIAGAIEYVIKK